MNSRKKPSEELEKRIKPCPLDFRRVENFIKRAKKDLRTADLICDSDLETAYQIFYDGMLHAALAYMASEGVRPDIRGKHKTIVDYVGQALGKRYETKIQFYDRMRKRRHQLLYEPAPFQCTEKEIEDARQVAQEFIALISEKIRERSPQKEFDFG